MALLLRSWYWEWRSKECCSLTHCRQWGSFFHDNLLTFSVTFWTNHIVFFLTCDGPDVIWYICPCYSVTTIEVKSWYCGPRQRESFFHENLSNATKSVFGNFCPVLGKFFTWSLKKAYIVKSLKCIPCAFCHRLALDSNGLKTFLKVDKSLFVSSHFQKVTK